MKKENKRDWKRKVKAADKLKPYIESAYYLIVTPEPWQDEIGLVLQEAQDFGPPPNDPRPRDWDVTRWGVISTKSQTQTGTRCKIRIIYSPSTTMRVGKSAR